MPPIREWLALSQSYHDVAAVIGWDRAVELGMAVWERKRPPSRQRRSGSDHGEGGFIYIPACIPDQSDHEVVQFVGLDAARQLADKFGGMQLFFPSIERASIPRRNAAIAEQVRDGWPVSTVATTFDLGEKQIRIICKQQGVSPQNALPAMRARRAWRQQGVRAAIRAAVASGDDAVESARKWGFVPCVAENVLSAKIKA